jgi:acetyl esterase
MALDPAFRAMLEMPGMQLSPPPPEVTVAMVREATKQLRPPMTGAPVHEVRELRVQGGAGQIDARLYRPSASKPLPMIVFFHGGGFVLCDLDSHDALCRSLANATGCVVTAVDYRLAPETPFPGPVEDCYAALLELAARAGELGVDAERLSVCGDSAGGNLATVVAHLVRQRGGPRLRHQALLCPVTDASCESASMTSLASGYFLSRDMMRWFWKCYLPAPDDVRNPLASPLRAENLSGLPAATIVTAEFDPARDEAEAYADRLRDAGVPVVARRYLGMIHGFMSMPLVTPLADRALADVAQDIRAAMQ